ncbi:MAG TPA: hypothetical protein VFM22_06575 [Castellaniella sp.]|jgi:hypothetical protein|nr:hypothetical protein [Castellaniella sp.]
MMLELTSVRFVYVCFNWMSPLANAAWKWIPPEWVTGELMVIVLSLGWRWRRMPLAG